MYTTDQDNSFDEITTDYTDFDKITKYVFTQYSN